MKNRAEEFIKTMIDTYHYPDEDPIPGEYAMRQALSKAFNTFWDTLDRDDWNDTLEDLLQFKQQLEKD